MHILVQWSVSNPGDWEEIPAEDFSLLPVKEDPTGLNSVVDGSRGWLNRLSCQGVEFTADHYWAEKLPNGDCRIVVWNDDPKYYPDRYAHEWIISPLQYDTYLNGAVNTKQIHRVYAEPHMYSLWEAQKPYAILELKQWKDLSLPSNPIHGINMPDLLYNGHESIRTLRSWREWTDGLPSDEIVNGKVRCQRQLGRYIPPDGTRTYYHNPSGGLGPHAADNTNTLGLTPEGVTTETSNNISGGGDTLAFDATTPPNEPNSAAWPTGNYRYQLDCSAVGADVTYGLLTRGASDGHFGRISSTGSHIEGNVQSEGAFSGTGLKLATTGSVSWSTGAADNRFEIAVAAGRPASHGNQSLSLDVGETDDFADGPWAAGGPAAGLRTLSLTGVGI